MGCNYKIYGTITLRRSQEVEVLLDALRERLDDGAIAVEELDENTIDLALNFDDATTIHTPPVLAREIPLPPVTEQQRIVARTDELSAKIEEARGLRKQTTDEAGALVNAELRV